MIVILIGAVGFAVDLGWLYWNSTEIQHGADAAALSGVVHVVEDPNQAKVAARATAAANGYVDTTLGGGDSVVVIDIADDPGAVANASQLRATVTHQVPTFFMNILG